jgi:hypothetical protein
LVTEKKQAWEEAKTKLKNRTLTRDSKGAASTRSLAVKSNAAGRAKGSAPTGRSPFNGTQPTVTKQTNALGQTVYSIAPSHFDISPPLKELAQIKVPAGPAGT